MRETKFRGLSVKLNEWVYGDLQHNEIGDTWISKLTADLQGVGGLFVNVLPETVGEWTGLTDNNGKEIYEGDIVRGIGKSAIFEIGFKDGYFTWGDDPIVLEVDEGIMETFRTEEWAEVVGTIHEDKHLLK